MTTALAAILEQTHAVDQAIEAGTRQPGSLRFEWTFGITHPGGWGDRRPTQGDYCTASILSRDRRDDGGHLEYRGVCMTCGWVSDSLRTSENAAVEDALDHTHPGFRDLPVLPHRPSGDAPTQMQRWRDEMAALLAPWLPDGWAETEGPVWTTRTPHGTRHVPGWGVFGGYDLGTLRAANIANPTQDELF